MISRLHLALVVGSLALTSTLAGCNAYDNPGPLRYDESESMTREVPNQATLAGKPKLQDAVRKGLAKLFGPDPQHIRVPAGSGLPGGGIRLANMHQTGDDAQPVVKRIRVARLDPSGQKVIEEQAGGYALYRRHCLHCHGVSGAGNGPTADFLYPRPRDYRPGKFKFTSTPNGAKPTRDDLRRTIRDGLHGTSMPAFEALMTHAEIEQVLDYILFLSLRGETELALIDEASVADENDPQALGDDVLDAAVRAVAGKWRTAETQVFNPPVPRTPPTPQSVRRGRDLFLGYKSRKGNTVECAGCHGAQALGDGPSFVAQDVFNHVVFGGDPNTRAERLAHYDDKTRELWKNSLDEWGQPLRPNNLNRGVYKGGRRPIDLYWRIAKGITGAKMPAHIPTLEADEVWDLVNFVLELPYEPELLRGAVPATPATAPAKPAVAQR